MERMDRGKFIWPQTVDGVVSLSPGQIVEAACWVHARRPFFIMADLDENARRRAAGKKEIPLSPIAIEIVRRIDALFEIERPINPSTAKPPMNAGQFASR
jgi:hypothetical protein